MRCVRLAGGRAAVFHEGTLEVAHAAARPDPRAASTSASRPTATLMCRALARPRRRRARGRGGGRVLPRPLERQRRRRAQARGHRPARGRGRVAHRIGDRGRGRRAGPRGARAGVPRALALAWDPRDGGCGGRRGRRRELGGGPRRRAGRVRARARAGDRRGSTTRPWSWPATLAAEHRRRLPGARPPAGRAPAVSATASTSCGPYLAGQVVAHPGDRDQLRARDRRARWRGRRGTGSSGSSRPWTTVVGTGVAAAARFGRRRP